MFIINGKIHTMAGKIYETGYVRMKDKKIIEVGNQKECPTIPKEERVLDVDGAWVMSVLIDAHCHVGISEEKWGVIGDDCNEMTSPMTPHLRAIDAIKEGITSLMTGPEIQWRCLQRLYIRL